MLSMFTKGEARTLKAQKPCVDACVIAMGGQVGTKNQAPVHAINPRDPGGPGFM